MQAYTVTRSGGVTDWEFRVYIALLEEIGIDVTNVPRIPEPSTNSRWLYVWTDKRLAERFARELGLRLHDRTWVAEEISISSPETGPIAPLVIVAFPATKGTTFFLDSGSLARIGTHFPNVRLPGEIFLTKGTRFNDADPQSHPWDEFASTITGIPQEEIERMGGYRIESPDGKLLHEAVPVVVG